MLPNDTTTPTLGQSLLEGPEDSARENDLIDAREALGVVGDRAIFDRVLGFGWHHTDDQGRPYWVRSTFLDALGLVVAELRKGGPT